MIISFFNRNDKENLSPESQHLADLISGKIPRKKFFGNLAAEEKEDQPNKGNQAGTSKAAAAATEDSEDDEFVMERPRRVANFFAPPEGFTEVSFKFYFINMNSFS